MLLYGATMFLSAFLLFLIQPMIGKYILPWFGGTPAVWTTCMLFFQALLLGGYAYAHALASRWPLRRQATLHLCLLGVTVLAILWFSILPGQSWKPADDASPILRILGLLLATIGAPYLLLSATAPLLQSWFSHTRPGASPYRLYALSNLGSLLAILSYPFLIEPEISLSRQAAVWSWAFAIFGTLCILLAWKVRNIRAEEFIGTLPAPKAVEAENSKPGSGRYVLWLALTACSSIMLLATTSTMCQDLAVVPLLWILPLALYLLSFILCFQFERIYSRPLFLGGLAGAVVWTCFVLFGGVFIALRLQISSFSLTLFVACMVCHGELVRLKPGARYLTSFYLTIAAGGALGALLVTVGAPYLLKGFWEYHLGLLATALVALLVLFVDRKGLLAEGRRFAVESLWLALCAGGGMLAYMLEPQIFRSWRTYAATAAIVLMMPAASWLDRKGRLYWGRPLRVWVVWALLGSSWVFLGVVLRNHIRESMESSIDVARNFFGVLRVLEMYKDDPDFHSLNLMHGRIEHGFQYQDQEKRAWHVSYYGSQSGIGLALRLHPRRLESKGMRIGVIGLGTGTIATYGEPGDSICFYEINPEVVRLSDKYFTYRKDSRARIEVVLGDARISMERQRQRGESHQYDVLVVDAFSSDAIPVHLLTRECYQLYRYHLKEDGILAIHITNRYFDLSPVVRNLPLPEQKVQALWFHNLGNASLGSDRTDWVLLTSNAQFLADPEVRTCITPWQSPAPPALFWTDDYSNLIRLIHERIND